MARAQNAISPTIYSNSLNFIFLCENKAGLSTLDNYLDDFIFPRAALTNDCQKLMDTFRLVSKELGVPLAENTTEGPTTTKYCSGFGNR
jgi:hypothetical protein